MKIARRAGPAYTPYRLTMAFRSVNPDADEEELATFMVLRMTAENLPAMDDIRNLHARYSREFGPGAVLLRETVINHNAIFTFFIDDRFFGTLLASVGGGQASEFDFILDSETDCL